MVEQGKFRQCAIQDQRYTLVNNSELYDLDNDPGETKNLIELKPEIVATMRAAYEKWWGEVVPMMVNGRSDRRSLRVSSCGSWGEEGGSPERSLRGDFTAWQSGDSGAIGGTCGRCGA